MNRSPRRPGGAPPLARTTGNQFAPLDVAVLAGLASMWGFSFLFIKVAVAAMSPLWVVGVRTSVGALVLLVILRLRRRMLPRDPATWGRLLVLATLGNAIPWGLLAWAEQFIPSGLAAVINALTPSSTLLVAAAIGLERLTGRRIAGLALALGGTLLAVWTELGTPGRGAAAVAVVLATVCYGGAAVFAKRKVSGTHPPLVIATGQVLLAALISLPLAVVVGPMPLGAAVTPAVIASVLALGGLGTGAAFFLFYTLIARVGATNAAMVTYLVPVVGVAAGALLLAEPVGVNLVVGAALIVGGIWLAQREHTPTPVEQLEEASA